MAEVTPCGICGEEVDNQRSSWAWKHSHYSTVHLDYSLWLKRWTKNFFISTGIFIVSLIVADLLWFDYGLWYLAGFANLLFISTVYYELWNRKRGFLRFLREWREQHPGLPPNMSWEFFPGC